MKKDFLSPGAAVKMMFGSLAAVLLTALPIRVYQLFTMIEPDTGFYSHRNFTVGLLYFLLIAGAVVFMTVCYLPRKHSFGMTYSSDKAMGVLAVLTAVALIIDAGVATSALFGSFKDAVQETANSYVHESLLAILIRNGIFLIAIQVIFAVCSSVYFAVFAGGAFTGSKDYSKLRLLALSPLAWCIARLVLRFMSKINYRYVSDLLLELFMLCAMMFFFIAFARVNSRVNTDGAARKMYAFGLITVMMTLTVSVPRLIVVIIGEGDRLAKGYPLNLCDLFIGVFAAFYLLSCIRAAKNESVSAE